MRYMRDSELNLFQADRRAHPAGECWSSAASGATGQISPRVSAQVASTGPVASTEQRQHVGRQSFRMNSWEAVSRRDRYAMSATRFGLLIFVCLILASCTGIPSNVQPVDNFELSRYLGTWYEIARLDHSFERGLSNVSASYSLRDDGGVTVVNRGFKADNKEWKEAIGKAYFFSDPDVGRLKVSFFGPFYGGYNIIELDHENYQYALICGPDRSYLWILSRTKKMDHAVLDRLVSRASSLGFDTEKLILVSQD
jgi:apolipoprotein D and lipocalin family protein